MKSQEQAWTLSQLDNLKHQVRHVADEAKQNVRQLEDLIEALERRFQEEVTAERTRS